MSFIPLGKTLHEEKKFKTPLKGQVEASQILDCASCVLVEILGKEQAFHVKPLFVKHRTLTITCSNSVVAQEIRNNQNNIIGKINEKLGKKEIDSIRYLV